MAGVAKLQGVLRSKAGEADVGPLRERVATALRHAVAPLDDDLQLDPDAAQSVECPELDLWIMVQADWHQATGYLPVTMAAYELTRKSGFYEKNPGADVSVQQMVVEKCNRGRRQTKHETIKHCVVKIAADHAEPLIGIIAPISAAIQILEFQYVRDGLPMGRPAHQVFRRAPGCPPQMDEPFP